jgi:LacI family transcriptional regulator
VARLANVSQAVVSYVLNNKTAMAISAETRQRVLDAMAQIGYVPNRAARTLRTQRTHTIASIIPTITNPFYPTFVRGIQDTAESHGYEVIVYNTDGDETKEHKSLQSLAQGRVDGIIATFFHVADQQLRPLLERGIAIVCMRPYGRAPEDLPIDGIGVDNCAAARTAVSHLLERGHVRIALIAGRQAGGPHRAQGYREALAAHGVAITEELTCYADFGKQEEQEGYRCMRHLLTVRPRPTAVFAANDLMAMGAMMALREARLRIPDDVAVVGFDDIPAVRLLSPSLTTVAQFQQQMGTRAMELLLERLQGTAPPTGRSEETPFRLVVRESA